VAGRFGNVGQTDYSAANDLQGKVLSQLRRTRPDVRGLTIDWTAWAGIGMATRGSIPKIMELAGVEPLPPEVGVAWVRRELTSQADGYEVVVAGALGAMAAEFHDTGGLDPAALAVDGPFGAAGVRASVHDGLVVTSTVDPVTRPFLDHHRIDGTPVLPGVMGIEAFAEAARVLVPGWTVIGVENVDFLAPLKFYRDEPRALTVTALLHPDGEELVAECRLIAERGRPGADQLQRTVHFTGSVRLAAEAPAPETDHADIAEATTALTPAQVYRLYFHGPAYQVVGSAWRHGDGVAARFAADLPAPADASTVIAARLVELCFQAAGLWEAGLAGRLALPRHVDAVRLSSVPAEGPDLVATVRPDGRGGFDCVVRDGEGVIRVRVEGYRTVALPDPVPAEVSASIRSALSG
jgi:hypothetical protein